MKILAILIAALLAGCSTVKVQYIPDAYGVPVPHVNDVPYPMTNEERKVIADSILDFYCV